MHDLHVPGLDDVDVPARLALLEDRLPRSVLLLDERALGEQRDDGEEHHPDEEQPHRRREGEDHQRGLERERQIPEERDGADAELREVEHLGTPVAAREPRHHGQASEHQLRPLDMEPRNRGPQTPSVAAFLTWGMSWAGP